MSAVDMGGGGSSISLTRVQEDRCVSKFPRCANVDECGKFIISWKSAAKGGRQLLRDDSLAKSHVKVSHTTAHDYQITQN